MDSPTIASIDTIGLEAPLDEPFGYSQEWVETRTALLVRVEADDGTVGWGECWGPITGTKETIDDLLGSTLLGENPLDAERLHDTLYETGRTAYQSIVPLPAVSGLDIALHDLRGKILDQPVSTLLGGRRREDVPAYATGHYFKPVEGLEEQFDRIVAEAEENAKALGALKLKVGLGLLGYGPKADRELVERVRKAIGNDVTLMVDANYAYDRPTAERLGREFAKNDVYWFEEPVSPEHLDAYIDLRETLSVHVAGGECHAPAEFRRFLDAGAFDIAQPDVCNVGGLTAARRIADRAAATGVPLVPHVWGTPVTLAASLHLLAAIEQETWLEFDRSANPLREELSERAFAPTDDGRVIVPSGPGLGIELDTTMLDYYRTAE
jgi:D-galactarolactone cycloisomerase